MIRKGFAFVLIALFISTVLIGNTIDSPETFLGFKPGADRKLAHYDKIKEYFIKVGKESPRVDTHLIGKTTLNRDMVMSVISSEENMKNLDKYKEITRKLSLAEVGEEEARALAAQGKVVVFITCNLHSTEIGSSQMALLMLHHLATDNSPETLNILNNVVFVFMPSVNPDGQAMVTEWYEKNKGTKYEGGNMPWLYHHYAGHDNNRDWFKMNLRETWLVSREMYFNWFPQIMVDEHQMGSTGDRFFIPPFADPPSPGLHPLMWRTINLFGTRIAYDLEKRDFAGVASRGFFMGWWIGALDDCAWFHNIPGILFEAASVRTASPIYVEPEEVRSAVSRLNEERMFSPNPWKGGWWRLSDIVDYDYYATLSVLSTAATYHRELLMNSYKMAVDNIKMGKTEGPYAYIVPKKQRDPMTAQKFIKTLRMSNIQIYKLSEPLRSGNYYFDAGSYVVPMAQPYRPFVKNIFEYQSYPDLRRSPTESRILPYDGAGWTLHLGMGVNAKALKKPFKAKMEPVTLKGIFKQAFPQDLQDHIVLKASYNNSFMAASVLLKEGIDVWRNYDDASIPRGAFVVKKSNKSLAALKEVNETMPLTLTSKPSLPLAKYKKLKNFKVGLYQNYGHNMQEGWTRFIFDEFKINYDTIRFADFKKKNFLNQYDVLVFIGASKTQIESGKPPKRWERWFTPLPPEYSGGLGKDGHKALETFFKSGKTLIFMTNSTSYAIEKFKIPVSNVAENNKSLSCPGSYLKVNIKETELTFGMGSKAAIYYAEDPVFRTSIPRTYDQNRSTPMVFGTGSLLISGALEGGDTLYRRAPVVDFTRDRGRIILIGPNLLFRAQTEGTYKIVFNAMFTAAR